MLNVLLTGGNGYVGSNFLKKLLPQEEKYRVCSIVRQLSGSHSGNLNEIICDVRNTNKYKEHLLTSDYIVWFAANRKHFDSFNNLYLDNVQSIKDALVVLRNSKVLKCFIYISSISAIDEDNSQDQSNNIVTPYGYSKFLAEKEIRQALIPSLILRLPFMYGGGFKKYSHLWFWNKLVSFPLVEFKISQGCVSLLHLNDLSNILIKIMQCDFYITEQVIMLSDNVPHKLSEVVEIIRKIKCQKDKKIRVDISVLVKKIHPFIPFKSLKYWANIFYDNNNFVMNSCNVFDDKYHFLSLKEGLNETFKTK